MNQTVLVISLIVGFVGSLMFFVEPTERSQTVGMVFGIVAVAGLCLSFIPQEQAKLIYDSNGQIKGLQHFNGSGKQ